MCISKCNLLDFFIVNLSFPDDDIPHCPLYGVCTFIRFAKLCSRVNALNSRYKVVTVKLIKDGYRYSKRRKAFPKLYPRHSDLIVKCVLIVDLKASLQQGISEPEFCGDPVYKFRTIGVKSVFSEHLKRLTRDIK